MKQASCVPHLLEKGSPKEVSLRLGLSVRTSGASKRLYELLRSFVATRNRRFEWLVVLSCREREDLSAECLALLRGNGIPYMVLITETWGYAANVNSILDVSFSLDCRTVFFVGEDLRFRAAGWEESYADSVAARDGEFHSGLNDALDASIAVGLDNDRTCIQDSFLGVTREMFDAIGYLDEHSFLWARDALVDYSWRCFIAGLKNPVCLREGGSAQQFMDINWPEDSTRSAMFGSEIARYELTRDALRLRGRITLDFDEARSMKMLPRLVFSFGVPEPRLCDLRESGLVEDPPFEELPGISIRVLNLRQDLEKWCSISGQLGQLGLVPERAPGLDGRVPPLLHDWERYRDNCDETDLDRELGHRALESPGAWGYLITARSVILEAMSREQEAVLLFDDDVVLSEKSFGERIKRAINQLPEDWLMLYLGWTPRGERPDSVHDCGLVQSEGRCNGSFGVLMSHRAFLPLIEDLNALDTPFDECLRSLDKTYPGKSFVVDRPLVMPIVSASAVRPGQSQLTYVSEGCWEWSDFALGFQKSHIGINRTPSRAESLLVKLTGFDQRLFSLAIRLATLAKANFSIVWVVEHSIHAPRHLERLLRLDPRSRAALVPSLAPNWIDALTEGLQMNRIAVMDGSELHKALFCLQREGAVSPSGVGDLLAAGIAEEIRPRASARVETAPQAVRPAERIAVPLVPTLTPGFPTLDYGLAQALRSDGVRWLPHDGSERHPTAQRVEGPRGDECLRGVENWVRSKDDAIKFRDFATHLRLGKSNALSD